MLIQENSDLQQKLKILFGATRYATACISSNVDRQASQAICFSHLFTYCLYMKNPQTSLFTGLANTFVFAADTFVSAETRFCSRYLFLQKLVSAKLPE